MTTILGITSPVPRGAENIKRRVRAAINASVDNVASKLRKVVATSDDLSVVITRSPNGATVTVSGEAWERLVRGTKDRFIRPTNAQVLAFPANYTRKTIPNQFASRAGGASGPTIFSKGHMVRGIEAGNWVGLAVQQERPILERALRAAIRG